MSTTWSATQPNAHAYCEGEIRRLDAEVRRLQEGREFEQQALRNALPLLAERDTLRAQRDAVLALHRRVAVYMLADLCLCTDDAHADAHSENADGEWLCYATPLPDEDVCSTCTDTVGDWPEPYAWPCATARALGVTA